MGNMFFYDLGHHTSSGNAVEFTIGYLFIDSWSPGFLPECPIIELRAILVIISCFLAGVDCVKDVMRVSLEAA